MCWPHAFWLKLAITGRLRAALQAPSSSLSQNPKPLSLTCTGISETAGSEHTSAMLCNSQRDKEPAELLGEKQQEDRNQSATAPALAAPVLHGAGCLISESTR